MTARKPKRRTRRSFGAIRKLPSGRLQASVIGPDLLRYAAPQTFETRMDAEAWIAAERRLMDAGQWRPPTERAESRHQKGVTLREYGPVAVDRRRVRGEPLKPRTRALYLGLLERVVAPVLGDKPVVAITPEDVTRFYDGLDTTKPTQRAHAYALLRTIMNQAVEDKLISSNPAHIKGAGKTTRARDIKIATVDELQAITEAMPEHLRLVVPLAAWCGLRFGELAELRRGDVDLTRGALVITRAVVRVDGQDIVGSPKSVAGIRVVTIPPHVMPAVREHLDRHVGQGQDALLFTTLTGRRLIHTELTKTFTRARVAAGRPDLRLHDLRHTGATMAAQAGATTAELMKRLGHSTASAAMRYQHAADDRDRAIADALSKLAGA